MPLFDYKCKVCGHQYETWLLNSRSVAECPECKDTENQEKEFLNAPMAKVYSKGMPTCDRELANYAGNGKYFGPNGDLVSK